MKKWTPEEIQSTNIAILKITSLCKSFSDVFNMEIDVDDKAPLLKALIKSIEDVVKELKNNNKIIQ